MALELVYWAEGVRRPSPQTPPGQGRVVVAGSRLAVRGAECRAVLAFWGFQAYP